MSESSNEVEMKSEKREKKKKKQYESDSEGEETRTEKRKKKKKKKKHSESNNEDEEITPEKPKKRKDLSESSNEEEETRKEKRKKKKKKKKKKHSESNNEEEEIESKPEKPKKRLRVVTSVLTDAPNRIAPIVGYFSSGYNPDDSTELPEVKVYRNKNHRSSRLEVVVKPPESNVEFVGKSYEGEAAVHQPCQYALGILDKETQTLKVVQIAGNKIFRLEPRVMKRASTEETPEEQGEEAVKAEQSARKISDLTSLYGTKKQKAMDKRMRLLAQQTKTKDPSADAKINNEELKDTEATGYQNIPPHNLSAVTPEEAYLFDEIIPVPERAYLNDILGFLQSGFGGSPTFWEENYYPSFVRNRIHWLKSMQDGDKKTERAFTLSYITHLVNFYKLTSSSRHSKPHQTYGDAINKSKIGDAINKYKIPRAIFQKFSNMFLDPASNALSSEKKELIIGYILVLTLFADKFSSDPSDIAKDLGMATADLRVYFRQLGSKNVRDSTTGKYLWTLPVPLYISVQHPVRRKRKK